MAMPPVKERPSPGATALATHRESPRSMNQVSEPMPPLCALTWTPLRPQYRLRHEIRAGSAITLRVKQRSGPLGIGIPSGDQAAPAAPHYCCQNWLVKRRYLLTEMLTRLAGASETTRDTGDCRQTQPQLSE